MLEPVPICAHAFAAYGDVIEPKDEGYAINNGAARRYDNVARVSVPAQARASLFIAPPVSFPVSLWCMERHPLGSQMFVPLGDSSMVVVVSASDALDDLQAFFVASGQGINFAPGTWHHPLLCAGGEGRFFVVDAAVSEPNCDEVPVHGWQVAAPRSVR